MKKILSVPAIMLAVVLLGACTKRPPQKTPEQLRAASIQKVKTDSINKVKSFKKIALNGFDKFLKRQLSKDPDYGKTLETEDFILNDSIYVAKCRYAIKNIYGAVQQDDDAYLVVCRKNNKDYMFVGNEALIERYFKTNTAELIFDDSDVHSKIIKKISDSYFFDMDRFIEKGFDFSPF